MAKARKKTDKPKAIDPSEIMRLDSQPSVRVSTNWTPARVRQIQNSADSGSMQSVADLVDQILVDDRFSECLQSLADSVLGAELKWERGLRKRTKETVELSKEVDDDWWEAYSEAEWSQIIIWREVLGFAWARITWVVSADSTRWIPLLTFWHPRHFRYDKEKRQWYVRVDDTGLEEPVDAGDGEWAIFYRRGAHRPWASGLWRGLARWWMLKAYAISDWGVHSEKAARQVVEADEGVSAADRKALAADLYSASKDGVISLPKGFKYSLVEATANTRDIYQAQVDAANDAGTIAILGQNLTTSITENGSRAASETHERKEARKIRYVAESLSTGARAMILCWWAEYNFGAQARNKTPWAVWQVALPDDLGLKAEVLSTVADAVSKFKSVGKAIPDEKLEEDFGLVLEDVEPTEQHVEPAPGRQRQPQKQKPAPSKTTNRHVHAALSRGFVDGQIYADDVADSARDHAADDLEPFVTRLLAAIGAANDYESIRSAVHKAYANEAEPERLAELVEHAIVMAHLGGRLAVHEDAE